MKKQLSEAELSRVLKERGAGITRNARGQVVEVWCPSEGAGAIVRDLKACPSSLTILTHSVFTDEDASHLAALSGLRDLNVINTQMTGAGFRHLRGLEHLEILDCDPKKDADLALEHIGKLRGLRKLGLGGSISDTGLLALRPLAALQHLGLSATAVQGHTFQDLPNLGSLKILELEDTHVDDEGLGKLVGSKNLEELYLAGSKVTDGGLAGLKRFPSLKMLSLCRTKVSGAGLKHLADLRQLTRLDLSETGVTDTDVSAIGAIKSLRTLLLKKTKISKAGIEQLLIVLPKCEIIVDKGAWTPEFSRSYVRSSGA